MRALPLLWRARGDMRIQSSSRSSEAWRRAIGLLLGGQAGLLLLEPRRVVALPRDAGAAVELEDPAGDVVEEVAVVRDGDDRAGVLLRASARARRPTRRRGGWSARRGAAGRAWRAAAGTARRGGARRPRGSSTSASPGGRRSASMAISKVRSRSQAPAASILVWSSACSLEQLVDVGVGVAEGGADLVVAVEELPWSRRRPRRRCRRRPWSGRAAAPGAGSPTVKPGVRRASPVKPSSSPAMMRSSEDLPEPLDPMTPILAPG